MKIKITAVLCGLIGWMQVQAQSVFIQLDSLVVHNLEEDKGPFATQNDEIIIIEAVYCFDADTLLHWNCYGIKSLSDSANVFSIGNNNAIEMQDSLDYYLMLIEVDNGITADSISKEVQRMYLEYVYYPLPYLLNQVRLALGDDDLLYFDSFNYKRLSKMDPIIECHGMHMFNRFHYTFHVSIFKEE